MSRTEEAPRCIVLGGTGVLGQAVCRALASFGARIRFTFHRSESAARTLCAALPPGAAFAHLDLASATEVEARIEAFARELGGLDALVNCAAVGSTAAPGGPPRIERLEDIDERAFAQMLDVNVKGAFFACRRTVGILKACGGGNIVLVGSVDGIRPVPSSAHHATSKAALRGMVQSIAKEAGPDRIMINLVAPGILSDGASRALPPDVVAEYRRHCALRRTGLPEEAAAFIAWLAVENTYVTAQAIALDGGL